MGGAAPHSRDGAGIADRRLLALGPDTVGAAPRYRNRAEIADRGGRISTKQCRSAKLPVVTTRPKFSTIWSFANITTAGTASVLTVPPASITPMPPGLAMNCWPTTSGLSTVKFWARAGLEGQRADQREGGGTEEPAMPWLAGRNPQSGRQSRPLHSAQSAIKRPRSRDGPNQSTSTLRTLETDYYADKPHSRNRLGCYWRPAV